MKACSEVIINGMMRNLLVFAVIQQLVGPTAGLSEERMLCMLNLVKC
jgi:hypothetical protein